MMMLVYNNNQVQVQKRVAKWLPPLRSGVFSWARGQTNWTYYRSLIYNCQYDSSGFLILLIYDIQRNFRTLFSVITTPILILHPALRRRFRLGGVGSVVLWAHVPEIGGYWLRRRELPKLMCEPHPTPSRWNFGVKPRYLHKPQ